MDWNSVAEAIGITLGVVALPLVTLLGYLIVRKGTKESHVIEQRRAEIDGLNMAVESMNTALAAVNRRVDRLEDELSCEREYSLLLHAHISAGKPPPPPARPPFIPKFRTVPEGQG